MTTHAVALRLAPCLAIECKFWRGNDGWSGSSEHPAITVQAATFEQAKAEMEFALGEHIESLLETSRVIGRAQPA
jgi:predicted RNase H-like HicB family nuclease